jgi:hypothetical protein
MRNALIFILMATAATPLLAQSDDHKDRGERHQQQQQQQQQQRPQGRQERQAAPQQFQQQRFQRQQQVQQQPQVQQQQRFQRQQQFQQAPQAQQQRFERRQQFQQAPQGQQQRFDRRQQFQQQQQVQGDRRGNWNGQNVRGDNRNWRGSGERGGARWNRGWRNDQRYDWQRFRFSNRGAFHLGPYYAPYRGYGYNRLEIGIVLDSLFYNRNYWIDPGYYDLPPAPPGAEWVRYYNDVVLVDMYSGEVLDVIPDFFW